MPYDPHAPTPESRNLQFAVMWVGLIMMVLCLGHYLCDPDLRWTTLGYGIMIGGLINGALSYRSDDYFRAQCFVGMSWSIGLVAVYLFFLLILSVSDIAVVAGYRMTSHGETERFPMSAAGFANDATLLSMLVSLAFYLGFAFAMLRDRFFVGGDQ